MAQVNETIKRFWNKLIVAYVKYYPKRIKNVGLEGEIARSLVYSFKSGESQEIVAQETAKRLKETFGEKVEELVFTCIPASSAEKNEARYKAFSERVCELTGAINAYDHIKVSGERLAVHENRKVSEKKITKVQVIEFDEDFFKGKNCICFDDVLTSGKSWAAFGHKLEEFGANVIAGFFLSKTTYKVA